MESYKILLYSSIGCYLLTILGLDGSDIGFGLLIASAISWLAAGE